MSSSKKKRLLRQQVKKFLSRKKEILETVGPVDKKLSSLGERLSAIESGEIKRTVTQVDHAGLSYEVVEYGDNEEDEQDII